MRYGICIIVFLSIVVFSADAFCDPALIKNSEWPYTSVKTYLKPAPNALSIGEHQAYPADGIVILAVGDTISIYNVTDLSLIKSFNILTPDIIFDFSYRGDAGSEILYAATGEGGLQIFDLSDIASGNAPLLGSLTVSAANPGYKLNESSVVVEETIIDAQGIGYYNDIVFLADDNFGLRVINVADPLTPAEVTLTSQDPDNKRISGYIQPNIYGSFNTTGGYINADVLRFNGKTYAFIIDYYFGLRVFDVTDPAVINEPVSKSMKTNVLYSSIALVTDVFAAVGTDSRLYAYVTAVDVYGQDSVVSRLDILTDYANDDVVGNDGDDDILTTGSITNIGRTITPGDACGVFAINDAAYVADSDKGLQVVDVSTGVANDQGVLDYSVAGSYETDIKGAMSIGIKNDMLFMNDAANGLLKIDITDNTSPSLVSTVDPLISGNDVFANANYIYLLDENDGLRIFDQSIASKFVQKSFYEISTTTYDITVVGSYAYIANGITGLLSVNVSEPELPSSPVTMDTSGLLTAIDAYTSGTTSYLIGADDTDGIISINITDPVNPGNPVQVTTTGYITSAAKDVCVLGDYAYYADDNQGLKIVQLGAAAPFAVTGAKSTTGNAIAVAAFEIDATRYAVISDDTTGIQIEDVTDPSVIPETIGTIAPPDGGSFVSLAVLDNYLFASAAHNGVFVYDITDPAAPALFCSAETKNDAVDNFPYKIEDTVYLASAESNNGVVNYRLSTGEPIDPPEPFSDSVNSTCFISALTSLD